MDYYGGCIDWMVFGRSMDGKQMDGWNGLDGWYIDAG